MTPPPPCGSRSSTGWPRGPTTSHQAAARHRRPAGAAFLGCRLPEGERAGLRGERRPARRAGGQRVLALQHRRGRLVHPGLRIGVDARAADRAQQPGAAGRRPVRRARANGASRCTSTRAWPARRPRRSRRRATRRPIRRRPTPSRSPSAPAEGPPAFPGIPGHEPDIALAKRNAKNIGAAMDELRKLVPNHGSYVSESELLRARLARRLLGRELPAAAAGQGQVRSRRPVLRPPRRRQRGLEPRRLHAPIKCS